MGNTKLKLLYILEFMKRTDELHPLNTTQLGNMLREKGIDSDRKSIVRDLNTLSEYGYEIQRCRDQNLGFYMVEQEFEDFELKILADAVGNMNFLTVNDTESLIGKIRKLATKEGENLIVGTSGFDHQKKSPDAMNKVRIDMISRAIMSKKRILFQMTDFTVGGKKKLRRHGQWYEVSPYYLVLNNDQYYVIGQREGYTNLFHFRLDGLYRVRVIEEEARPIETCDEAVKQGGKFDISAYLREAVGMWGGDEELVRLRCDSSIWRDIGQKFGFGIPIESEDTVRGTFDVMVRVKDAPGFYQWLAAYGTHVTVMAPTSVRTRYLEYVLDIYRNYRMHFGDEEQMWKRWEGEEEAENKETTGKTLGSLMPAVEEEVEEEQPAPKARRSRKSEDD